MRTRFLLSILLAVSLLVPDVATARRRRRRYSGPPPTHPVVLWTRTLEESTDKEQRKIAAFKLSQYSQTIYQDNTVTALLKCSRDPEVEIKVLCTKALGHVDNRAHQEMVRKVLLELYQQDPSLKNTIVRTFVTRRDSNPSVHEALLATAKKSEDSDETLVLLEYFGSFGSGSDAFVDVLESLYQRSSNERVRRSVVKVLGDRAQGQKSVVLLLTQCTESKDTPLVLNCIGGLQLQARKDPTAWNAVEKTIMSDDADVLLATLDLINVLPEASRDTISKRLLEILAATEDDEIKEKAILALGVCGDHSEEIGVTLTKFLEDKDSDESIRIAAALVVGRQANNDGETSKSTLTKCISEINSPQLKTACQLGLRDLATRRTVIVKQPEKTETPPVATQEAKPESPADRKPTETQKETPPAPSTPAPAPASVAPVAPAAEPVQAAPTPEPTKQ